MVGNRTGARAEGHGVKLKVLTPLNLTFELDPPDWSDAKSFGSTTIYGKACKFDAVGDLEELQDQKVARLSEQAPPGQIEASYKPSSEASIFNLELQPNAP